MDPELGLIGRTSVWEASQGPVEWTVLERGSGLSRGVPRGGEDRGLGEVKPCRKREARGRFSFGGSTYFFSSSLLLPSPLWDPPDAWRGPLPKQILYSRTELSTPGGAKPHRPLVLRSRDFQEAQRHLVGAWAPQRNYTETLPLLERDAALTSSFPGQRTWGTRSAHPGLAPFFPHPAIALASRRPQRGHRGPPVPREMFQAFPGDYDSGSRCSSSPSAESQYLSSVDSFGSPPTAAASQVSSGGLRCCFVVYKFFEVKGGGGNQFPFPR